MVNNQSAILESERPFFFKRPGLVFFAGVFLLGVWLGKLHISVLSAIFISLWAISASWSRLSLVRVFHSRSLSETRIFPGEETTISTTLENKKAIPLAWLESSEDFILPDQTEIIESRQARAPLRPDSFFISAPLLWRRRLVRSLKISVGKRGIYQVGPAVLRSGDLFGLIPRVKSFDKIDRLIVYPKIYDLGVLKLPVQRPLGESTGTSRIFEDPTRTMGLREYTPDVPFRHIHWKASARRQRLQVKVFEPTTSLSAAIGLGVEGFELEDEETFELAVSMAASLVCHLADRKHPVGFFTNGVTGPDAGPVRINPGRGREQSMLILERMAGLTSEGALPFSDLVGGLPGRLPRGTTVSVFIRSLQPELATRLEELRLLGFKPSVFLFGRDPAPSVSIPCRKISGPEDFKL